jgi:sulfatase maturation enzyme AslB (radical SAM superfamily)
MKMCWNSWKIPDAQEEGSAYRFDIITPFFILPSEDVMNIYSFALFMTDACNFNCSYCYQKRGNTYIDTATLKKAISFFFPFLKKDCYVNFYGGEPLLALDKILFALDNIQFLNKTISKNIIFSMTTNASLLSDDVLNILNEYKFSLLISFDGITQDVSRKKGSFKKTAVILEKAKQYPQIDLETNSVFTPATIENLSESIMSIVRLGVPNISLAPSQIDVWDRTSLSYYKQELEVLAQRLIFYAKKNRQIPVVNFRRIYKKSVFSCYAAKDRMAMTPEGTLWGCHLFADAYKGKEETAAYAKFCFGDLDSFMKNPEKIYQKIAANYAHLRMDRFHTLNGRCDQCPDLLDCQVCPMDNVIQGRDFREIPDWVCEQKKIMREVKRKFWKNLNQ